MGLTHQHQHLCSCDTSFNKTVCALDRTIDSVKCYQLQKFGWYALLPHWRCHGDITSSIYLVFKTSSRFFIDWRGPPSCPHFIAFSRLADILPTFSSFHSTQNSLIEMLQCSPVLLFCVSFWDEHTLDILIVSIIRGIEYRRKSTVYSSDILLFFLKFFSSLAWSILYELCLGFCTSNGGLLEGLLNHTT